LQPGEVVSFVSGERRPLAAFAGRRVHAVAGIGDPARFFATLRAAGVEPIEHPFADHAALTAADIGFADDLPVLMTEKDAVKCTGFATARHAWLEVEAAFSADDGAHIVELVLEALWRRPRP
jgi:tetraacyldisaccharide 4'-kinase